jgi:hypothetical protein
MRYREAGRGHNRRPALIRLHESSQVQPNQADETLELLQKGLLAWLG